MYTVHNVVNGTIQNELTTSAQTRAQLISELIKLNYIRIGAELPRLPKFNRALIIANAYGLQSFVIKHV